MGIFGIGPCKWVGTGSPGTGTVIFTNGVLKMNLSEPINEILESAINGKKTFIEKGVHASFEIDYYLYKEGSPSSAATTVLSYLHKNVKFYINKDGITANDGLGKCLKNNAGTDITCRVVSIDIQKMSETSTKEIMIIKLMTNEPYDITKSIQ